MKYISSVFNPKIVYTIKHYSKEQFGKDVIAGIIVAIIALPLSIALAISSGVSPEKGIYTAIVAGFLTSLFGGSRVQIGGPTAAFMVIVFGIVAKHGVDGLMIATIMAGIMLMLFGLFKLGSVIKFIPYPITTGFTSGIAITIFTSQIKDFLGIVPKEAMPAEFIDKWAVYISSISTVQWQVVLVGVISLAILIAWPKITKKIPGALIALIVSAAIVKIFDMQVPTIGSMFGTLSSAPPAFRAPVITYERIVDLIGPAFTIAFLGAVESLLSAVVSDGLIGSKHNSNTELIAQGIANIGSSLFGGIPATGAIARTVANIKNGGRTPVAGIVHSVVLLLIVLLFMPFAKMIPLTALAAVLLVVAYNMSEWRSFVGLLKAPKSDIAILLVTFLMTVLFDLVLAIEVGIVLAAFLFMKRMSDVAEVKVRNMDAGEEDIGSGISESSGDGEESEFSGGKKYKNVLIYEINGPFFFGAADKFLDASTQVGEKIEILIIKMKHVPVMDATALQAFRGLIRRSQKKSIEVILAGVQDQPLAVLKKAGLCNSIGEDRIFPSLTPAIKYVKEKLEAAT